MAREEKGLWSSRCLMGNGVSGFQGSTLWDPQVPRANDYWMIWQTGIKFAAGLKAANKSPGRFNASRGPKHSRIGSRRHRGGMKDIVTAPGSEGTGSQIRDVGSL